MLRRLVVTAVTGLCALAGPAAAPALAATAPVVTLSTASVRPGVAFTATAEAGCPAGGGVQDVDFTFTDSTGTTVGVGTTQTDEDGSWAGATLQLPVTGIDDDGDWVTDPVATGPGSVTATCYGSEESNDPGPDDDGSDDDGSDDDGDGVVTETYSPVALSVSGPAAALSLDATLVQPGDTVTVTPGAPCPGAADVEVDLVALGDDAATAEEAAATTDGSGAWPAVTLTLPDDAEAGDYGITADCVSGDETLASYAGAGLGVGTLRLGAPDCGGSPVTARLTGTFDGAVAGVSPLRGKARAVRAPATVRFGGRGPWDVTLRSAVTGTHLLATTVTCPEADYELDVPRTGVTGSGTIRARVCNTGNAPVGAALQVRPGKRFTEVDDAALDAGDCTWLAGGRVARGDSVAARVVLDAPGAGDDEVSASFTARRHR